MTRPAPLRALLLPLVVAAPVLAGLAYSLMAAFGLTGFGGGAPGPGRVARVLAEPAVHASVGWTLATALASTLLATGAAVATSVALRGRARLDRLGRTLATLPLPVPHLVAAATALLVLGQAGLLARLGAALGLVSGPADMPALVYDRAGIGLVLALAWKEFPYLALVASSVLATRGARLEEAARTLGATPAQAFRRVTWPVLRRGLAPAVVAVFAFVVGSWEAPRLLAPSAPLHLSLLTYERYTDPDLARRADAFVLAVVALALAGAAVALHEWAARRRDDLE